MWFLAEIDEYYADVRYERIAIINVSMIYMAYYGDDIPLPRCWNLKNNQLIGPIPSTLTQIPNLKTL